MNDKPVRGPERAYFQRPRGDYTKVSSTGTLILSASELAFRTRIGRDVTVTLADTADRGLVRGRARAALTSAG